MRNLIFVVFTIASMLFGSYAYAENGNLIVDGKIGVGTETPATKLQVNGEIMIGNTGLECTSVAAGALRYNPESTSYEFCNGTAWQKLGNAQRINVAAKVNGGVATASSSHSSSYPPQAVTDGERKGLIWNEGGGWNDGTSNSFPDWIQIIFSGQKSIVEIDVFTIQDAYTNPVEPTPTKTFSVYGITAFDVQYWNGSSWVTVPGGSITNNNLVWRKFTFPAVQTDRIRVQVNGSADGACSRITEIEAYE